MLIIATAAAARLGNAALAAHQIAFRLFGLLAFALDAIAIAGQAITGKYLGAGDVTSLADDLLPMLAARSSAR